MDEQTKTADPDAQLAAVPDDVKAADSTGYAVYDRTVGQYVGPVKHGRDKPTEAEIAAAVPEGHEHAVVRV